MNKDIMEPGFLVRKNPNEETFQEVSNAVKDNEGYCCCEMYKTPDTKCMCKNFREQEDGGFCHCGRFYKVKDYPIITILATPEENEKALFVAEGLTTQGFIVLLPLYGNSGNYLKYSTIFSDIQRTKIEKADLVFVINSSEEAMNFLEEEVYWAQELNKKIIYEHTESAEE